MLIFAPLSAFAGLGGDLNSIVTDQVHFQGSVQATQKAEYTVHEIRSASGTVIREYVSPAGKVFAVTWHGGWPPDLHQLLGSYFPEYQDAARADAASAHPFRRVMRLEQPDFVFQAGGHLRSFVGRAYVPQMLPPGVQVEELQ